MKLLKPEKTGRMTMIHVKENDMNKAVENPRTERKRKRGRNY